MDVTENHYLELIKRSPNKKHWKVREFKKIIDLDITGYRFFAYQNRPRNVVHFCNFYANNLEKKLKNALNGI